MCGLARPLWWCCSWRAALVAFLAVSLTIALSSMVVAMVVDEVRARRA